MFCVLCIFVGFKYVMCGIICVCGVGIFVVEEGVVFSGDWRKDKKIVFEIIGFLYI